MGVCNWFYLSNGVDLLEDEANIEITARLKSEQQKRDTDKTALLIGPPNCGKTTILKQFYFTQRAPGVRAVDGDFKRLLSADDRASSVSSILEEIRSNCIETINILAHYLRTKVSTRARRRCSCTDHFYVASKPRPHLEELQRAWHGVRHLYAAKSIAPNRRPSRWLRLKENMSYFMERLEEIMDDQYQLTPTDLIMVPNS